MDSFPIITVSHHFNLLLMKSSGFYPSSSPPPPKKNISTPFEMIIFVRKLKKKSLSNLKKFWEVNIF